MKRFLSLLTLILTVVSTDAQVVLRGDAYKDNIIDGKECLGVGEHTLVLEGENVIRGSNRQTPGISAPANGTLVITGSGSLDVSSGRNRSCGDITISEPTKKVYLISGGDGAEYIGKGSGNATCGTITIDGIVNATTKTKLEHYGWCYDGNTLELGHSSY